MSNRLLNLHGLRWTSQAESVTLLLLVCLVVPLKRLVAAVRRCALGRNTHSQRQAVLSHLQHPEPVQRDPGCPA